MINTEREKFKGYFGRYQQIAALTHYNLLYFTLFFMVAHCLFSILTLNYSFLLIYAIIIILQSQAKKSQKYINFITNSLPFTKAFKSFTVKYEEQIPETEKCLFGYHPHGAAALGFIPCMNLMSEQHR